eukprot:2220259-Prymnesium_polylepis.1
MAAMSCIMSGGAAATRKRNGTCTHVGLGEEALYLAPDPAHHRVLLVSRRCVVGVEASIAQ